MTALAEPAGAAAVPPATSLPPGPPLPSAVQTPLYWARPLEYLRACRRRYGSAFTIRAEPFGKLVYVCDPEDIRTVFSGDPAVFHAGEGNALLAKVLGRRSVLVLDEEEHLRTRRRLLPPFHGESVRAYGEIVARLAAAEVERWPLGRPFALHPRMRAITLEVILEAVLGVEDPARLAALREVIPRITNISALLMLAWAWPALDRHGPWRRYARVQRRLSALLREEIRLRRAVPDLDARSDVLSLLLRGEEQLDDDDLHDQLVTLLLAGHETTTTGLAWAFERLLRTPAALARAAQGDEAYLDAVVRETLRVRPVIADVARQLTQPAEVAGHLLPAGVTVMPSIALVQTAPEHYHRPLDFRPERFLGGGEEGLEGGRREGSGYTWIPFGGGRRRCLGAPFAQFEMRVVLRTVLAGARLEAADPKPEGVRVKHITLVPAHGARAVRRA